MEPKTITMQELLRLFADGHLAVAIGDGKGKPILGSQVKRVMAEDGKGFDAAVQKLHEARVRKQRQGGKQKA